MNKKLAKAQAKAAKKEAKLKYSGIESDKDWVKRSTEAAERNARIRMWQLIVAILAGCAVVAGVVWQIFKTS